MSSRHLQLAPDADRSLRAGSYVAEPEPGPFVPLDSRIDRVIARFVAAGFEERCVRVREKAIVDWLLAGLTPSVLDVAIGEALTATSGKPCRMPVAFLEKRVPVLIAEAKLEREATALRTLDTFANEPPPDAEHEAAKAALAACHEGTAVLAAENVAEAMRQGQRVPTEQPR